MNEDKPSGWSFAMWVLLAILVFLIVGALAPMFIRGGGHRGGWADQREAVNNARQIGMALFEFETEYGRFPDETTAAKVRQKTGTKLELGSASANDYFRQLIAAEMVSSDRLFYAKTAFSKKASGSAERGDWTLEEGVVGFGYLMNGESAFNTEGNPSRVIACTPLAFDGKAVSNEKFDLDMYDGKAVALRVDNSVTSFPILKKSHLVTLQGGKTLLETGPDTVWGDSAKPVIVPPLPKR